MNSRPNTAAFVYNKKDKEMYIFFVNDNGNFFSMGQKERHYGDGCDDYTAHQRLKEESFNLYKEIDKRYKKDLTEDYKYAQVIKNVIYKYGECRLTKINPEDKRGYEMVTMAIINDLNNINAEILKK